MAETLKEMTVKLDNNGTTINDRIVVKQWDTKSRYLIFNLQNSYGNPMNLSDCEVKCSQLTPPDKKNPNGIYMYHHVDISNAVSGKITLGLNTTATSVPGNNKFEITIYDWRYKQILSTLIFFIEVEESIRNDDAVEGTNLYSGLTNLMFQMLELWDFWRYIEKLIGFPINDDGEKISLFKYLRAIYDYLVNIADKKIDEIIEKINELIENGTGGGSPSSGFKVFMEDGVFTVPKNVNMITVTACAAGGGGSGGRGQGVDGPIGDSPTGDGQYGQIIVRKKFSVTPEEDIEITIGRGGQGGIGGQYESHTNGSAGGNTVIGNIVTLIGGSGGGTTWMSLPPQSGWNVGWNSSQDRVSFGGAGGGVVNPIGQAVFTGNGDQQIGQENGSTINYGYRNFYPSDGTVCICSDNNTAGFNGQITDIFDYDIQTSSGGNRGGLGGYVAIHERAGKGVTFTMGGASKGGDGGGARHGYGGIGGNGGEGAVFVGGDEYYNYAGTVFTSAGRGGQGGGGGGYGAGGGGGIDAVSLIEEQAYQYEIHVGSMIRNAQGGSGGMGGQGVVLIEW